MAVVTKASTMKMAATSQTVVRLTSAASAGGGAWMAAPLRRNTQAWIGRLTKRGAAANSRTVVRQSRVCRAVPLIAQPTVLANPPISATSEIIGRAARSWRVPKVPNTVS